MVFYVSPLYYISVTRHLMLQFEDMQPSNWFYANELMDLPTIDVIIFLYKSNCLNRFTWQSVI